MCHRPPCAVDILLPSRVQGHSNQKADAAVLAGSLTGSPLPEATAFAPASIARTAGFYRGGSRLCALDRARPWGSLRACGRRRGAENPLLRCGPPPANDESAEQTGGQAGAEVIRTSGRPMQRARACLLAVACMYSDAVSLRDAVTQLQRPQPNSRSEAGWTPTEITGDQNFDSAWMAAWENKDRIRCPFFKRRATDLLEAALAVGRFILARHKSLLPLASRSKGAPKITGQTAEAVLEIIRRDFEEKRYYITGHVTREIYDDACFFDAPGMRGKRVLYDAQK